MGKRSNDSNFAEYLGAPLLSSWTLLPFLLFFYKSCHFSLLLFSRLFKMFLMVLENEEKVSGRMNSLKHPHPKEWPLEPQGHSGPLWSQLPSDLPWVVSRGGSWKTVLSAFLRVCWEASLIWSSIWWYNMMYLVNELLKIAGKLDHLRIRWSLLQASSLPILLSLDWELVPEGGNEVRQTQCQHLCFWFLIIYNTFKKSLVFPNIVHIWNGDGWFGEGDGVEN